MPLSPIVSAALREFDDSIAEARRSREGELRIQPSERERLETEWQFVAPALHRFLDRIVGQCALVNHASSRDLSEISARFHDGSPRGCYLILSRRHPTDPHASFGTAWLTTIGASPEEHTDAVGAAKEVIRRILAAKG